jgi:hypothetical protein
MGPASQNTCTENGASHCTILGMTQFELDEEVDRHIMAEPVAISTRTEPVISNMSSR